MTNRVTRIEKLEAKANHGVEYVVAATADELDTKIDTRLRDKTRKSAKLVGIITGVPRAN